MQRRSKTEPTLLTAIIVFVLLNFAHIFLATAGLHFASFMANQLSHSVREWAVEGLPLGEKAPRSEWKPVTPQELKDRIAAGQTWDYFSFDTKQCTINMQAKSPTDELAVFRHRSGLNWGEDVARVNTLGDVTFERASLIPAQLTFIAIALLLAPLGAPVGGWLWSLRPIHQPPKEARGFDPLPPQK